MRLRLIHILAVLALGGCFDAPRPNCAFLCGPANECPTDYVCASDNRCHLVENGVPVASCGDELPADAAAQDAPIDASGPDAMSTPDAMPDAMVPVSTHSGTISLQEVRLLGSGAALGSGLLFSADFPALADQRAPDLVEGVLTSGCTGYLYDIATGDTPATGGDEGAVTVAGTTAHMPAPSAGPPPTGCLFVPGSGYLCLDGAGAGATTFVALGGGAFLVTVAGATSLATDPGHYMAVSGMTNPGNNGTFPVLDVNAGGWVLGVGAAGAAEAATATGQYQLIAGAGPVPTSPEAIADGDMVVVGMIPGGGNHIDFPDTMAIPAGNSFSPTAATAALMQAMPTNAAADLTISCAGDPGCAVGSAQGTIVVIQTTDANVLPGVAPDYYFPAATGKMAYIQCRAIATDTVVVSTAMQQLIADSGATRIRTTIFRDGFALTGNPDGLNPTNVVVGHGVIGFTTITPPASCTDGLHNGTETDVDCGGSCPLNCADGEMCASAGDCTSFVCTGSICQVPTCSDGAINGSETDVDCGGASCGATCGPGDMCGVGGDCAGGTCTGGTCAATCSDGVMNNGETDIDCGGANCGPTCVIGDTCSVNGDCVTDTCSGGMCVAAVVCSPALAPADDGSGAALQALVISEINPGDYIELYNTTGSDILSTTSAYQLCSPFSYWSLSSMPGITIPAGGYATLPWPPSFTDVDAGGEVILYLDSLTGFGDGTKVMDFVCWGTNPHPSRKALAESAGKWTTAAACAGALTGGAIHRLIGSDGVDPTDYDVVTVASPMNCTP